MEFQILVMVQNLTILPYLTVSDGNSSPTYRWAMPFTRLKWGYPCRLQMKKRWEDVDFFEVDF